jgi:hypothetical protein
MGSKKKFVLLAVLLVGILGFMASFLGGSQSGTYEGRVLVAGHGGHIADANVVINPTAAKDTINIPSYLLWTGNKLHFVPLGESADHAIHDVRVDSQNPNIAFWSTYTAKKPSVIVGKADLKTNKWLVEKKLDLPKEVIEFGKTTTKTLYCASGQTEKYFLPIFMGYPGFIDVIDKKTLELKRRVMLASNPDLPVNYMYAHGASSPDNKYLYLVINGAEGPHGKITGVEHFFVLDLPALVEKGEIKVLRKTTLTFPSGTITFRASFTPDSKYILQAARTRTLVLKTEDLSLVQQTPVPEGIETHDILPTPDGRYGISTVRVPVDYEGTKVTDGQIWLYDIANNKYLGEPVSTCRACHLKNQKHIPLTWGLEIAGCTRCHLDPRNSIHLLGDNILCGADAVLTKK